MSQAWYNKNKKKYNAKRRRLYKADGSKQKEHNKAYYHKNKEELYQKRKEYFVKRYKEKRVEILTREKKNNAIRRQRILKLLGGKCVKCGFSDWRALQVDHVNGGGHKERKRVKGYGHALESLIKEDSDKYQLLCANCNWIKKYENNENAKS